VKKNRTFRKFEDWHAIDVMDKLGIQLVQDSPAMRD